MICFSKTGSNHIFDDKNCQDMASYFMYPSYQMKLVTDGCGSAKHPEVGVKLFHQAFEYNELQYEIPFSLSNIQDEVDLVFDELLSNAKNMGEDKFILHNFLFTILFVIENTDNFTVYSMGDGYIIRQDLNGVISFEELNGVMIFDREEYPKYFGYNKVKNRDLLGRSRDVPHLLFEEKVFPKSEWKKIGIASDGIRFILAEPEHSINYQQFIKFLSMNKEGRIKQLVNRHSSLFKDDISICF
jgi:hypothetical protein